ncbi:MAG: hypothetical protein OXG25_10275 [Gammaproteobacteria bacterium]|nr:hypothetical protein [Gammaproteobacteria bacterium]
MSVDDEFRAIKHVLSKLATDGEAPGAISDFKTKRAAQSKFRPLRAVDLEYTFISKKSEGDFGNQAVFLVPPKHENYGTVALWCKWKVDDTLCSFNYYLGIWRRPFSFIGFRYEMPEIGCNHNYFHSQPCKNLGNRADEIEGALRVSERYPSWPLAAKSALDLLLCVVTSLHGMEGLKELFKHVDDDPKMRNNDVLGRARQDMYALQTRASI